MKTRFKDNQQISVWEDSGVPLILRTLEFSDFKNAIERSILQEMVSFINEFNRKKPSGLYLFSSQPGTGKSGLASCILKTLISTRKVLDSAFFVNYVDLLMDARSGYNENSNYESSDSVRRVLGSDIVVIDEFAMQKATEFAIDFMRWLVNKIWENQRRIMFTSNFSIADLKKRLIVDGDSIAADAIVSRLSSICTSTLAIRTPVDFRTER